MIKRGMGKKGEFYLIAAIIIAIAVIGIISVVNFSTTQNEVNLDEFKEEIQIESSYILDYANYNSLTGKETNEILEDFTEDYINSKSFGKNMYFIFGDKSNFTLKAYQSSSESVVIETSGVPETLGVTPNEIYTNYFSTSDNVTLIIENYEKNFEIREGESFYFIISSKNNGEKHVVSN